MKVVCGQKRKAGNPTETLALTADFRQKTDFALHYSYRISMVSESRKNAGSQVSTVLVVTTLSPMTNLFYHGFMF